MMIISVMILVMVDGYYCYLFCCWMDMVSCKCQQVAHCRFCISGFSSFTLRFPRPAPHLNHKLFGTAALTLQNSYLYL
ncbi:hypothetical protein I3842_03G019800 [Carya illinoinensis]|uniref:Uncharacterized protein n=1 Tax=Carya illinoinensis TaxID=32201 RepID=A0A922JWF6_CARIL|nr:hypothetical protein I3842_03G019800 [Carya illinoinensis]